MLLVDVVLSEVVVVLVDVVLSDVVVLLVDVVLPDVVLLLVDVMLFEKKMIPFFTTCQTFTTILTMMNRTCVFFVKLDMWLQLSYTC